VTLDELRGVLIARRDAIIRARFDRIDTSRNKLIEPAEFIAWQAALGSAAASDRQSMGQDNGPISESLSPTLGDDQEDRLLKRVIEPLSATLITNANSNYDRGLSLDELLAYERQKFDALDTNKDGFIVMEELHAQKPGEGEGNGPRSGTRGPGMVRAGGPPPPCGPDGNC
ncbi:MAG: calcium-binding protein, partial [Sphingobium sp.]